MAADINPLTMPMSRLNKLDLEDYLRRRRVDRDVSPVRKQQYGVRTNPMNRTAPLGPARRPTYPFEDVNPMDLYDNLSTLLNMRRLRSQQIPSLPYSRMQDRYKLDGVRF